MLPCADLPTASEADWATLPRRTDSRDRRKDTPSGWYSSTSMTNNRLDVLRGMVASNPNDSFARYGLAMEYVKSGKLQDAVAEFDKLLELNANYAAAYFHSGQALEKLGKLEQARAVYQK